MDLPAANPRSSRVLVSHLKGRQPRGEFTGSQIKKLRRDMRFNGYNEAFPIEIAEVDGYKIIIDGHHRARAAGAEGILEVPVKINRVTPEEAATLLEQAAEAAEQLGLPF